MKLPALLLLVFIATLPAQAQSPWAHLTPEGHLTYAATGWKTTGDALLASTAADQARKRHQAGNEELTGQYDTTSGRQAA